MKTKDSSREILLVVEDALMLAQFELEYMETLNEFKYSLGYISKDFEVEGLLS